MNTYLWDTLLIKNLLRHSGNAEGPDDIQASGGPEAETMPRTKKTLVFLPWSPRALALLTLQVTSHSLMTSRVPLKGCPVLLDPWSHHLMLKDSFCLGPDSREPGAKDTLGTEGSLLRPFCDHHRSQRGTSFMPATLGCHQSDSAGDSRVNNTQPLPFRRSDFRKQGRHLKKFFKEGKIKEAQIKSSRVLQEWMTNFTEEIIIEQF